MSPEIAGDLGQGDVHDEEVQAGQDHAGADDKEHLAGAGRRLRPRGPHGLASGSEFYHEMNFNVVAFYHATH